MKCVTVELREQEGSSFNHFHLSVKRDLSYMYSTGSDMEVTFRKGRLLTGFHPRLLEEAKCCRIRGRVQRWLNK